MGDALSSTAVQTGSLIGPAIGGALVATAGASTAAFGIDAVSFAASAVSLALIPRRAAAALLLLGVCNGLGNVRFYTMAQRSIPRPYSATS